MGKKAVEFIYFRIEKKNVTMKGMEFFCLNQFLIKIQSSTPLGYAAVNWISANLKIFHEATRDTD